MALQAADIADLVNLTQNELGVGKLTDLTSDLQDHVAANRLIKQNKVGFDSGKAINVNTLMTAGNNARHVGLFGVDNVNQRDGTVIGSVPWRHTVTGYTYDVRQVKMNTGSAQIVDFVKTKVHQQDVELIELLEATFWGEPTASTDDTTPFGVKYWLVYNATAGFNGGNNANFAAGPAGISRTTYARWKNYTANYANVTQDDLVDKLRAALWYCRFRPTVPNPSIGDFNTGDRWGLYTTYDVVAAAEKLAKAQNDSLGFNLAPADGRVMIKRSSLEAVPYLQENEATADPVVGIDWGVFKIVGLRGQYMVQSPVERSSGNHNVYESFKDMSHNIVCYDPRRCFLVAKSDWSA